MTRATTSRRWILIAALLTGCPAGVPTKPIVGATPTAKPKAETSAKPSAKPGDPLPTPSSGAVKPLSYTGKVFGLDGAPAANVPVSGLVSDLGGSLVSDLGGSILSNNGGSLVGKVRYRLAQAALSTRTAADGSFTLTSPDGKNLNIEAVAEPTLKAIRLVVPPGSTNVDLRLARTGSISGKVTAPGVTDFLGIDVFIPGTSYTAKADSAGRYKLDQVPVGSFLVVAQKTGLGAAAQENVAVASEKDTTAGDLVLAFKAPAINSVTPAAAGPGTEVTINGENFKSSSGEAFQVLFGGVTAIAPTRVDDKTIKAKVPAGAGVAGVVVAVEGVQSNLAPFRSLKSLVPSMGNLILTVGAQQAFSFSALDAADQPLPDPGAGLFVAVTGAAASFEGGQVKAMATGEATLTATSGTLTEAIRVVVRAAEPVVSQLVGGLQDPRDLAFDAAGDLLVADQALGGIQRIKFGPGGATLARAYGAAERGHLDGPIATARFQGPGGLCIAPDGTIYVADDGNPRIRRIKDGMVDTIAGTGGQGIDDGPGNVAQFDDPHGLALDGKGNLWVSDKENHAIRRISLTDGQFTTKTIVGNNINDHVDGPADVARLDSPDAIAFDKDGSLLVVETGNHCIRRITFDAAGAATVSTWVGTPKVAGRVDRQGLAAKFDTPHGLIFDKAGNAYVSEAGNRVIRMITPDGHVLTWAGTGVENNENGPASKASFDSLRYITFGPDGTMYACDKDTEEIRAIKP